MQIRCYNNFTIIRVVMSESILINSRSKDSSLKLNISQFIQNKTFIQDLVAKFSNVSSSIQLNLNKNALNLIEYERQNEKIKHDPQISLARLRRLENQVQFRRAESELGNQRKIKRHSMRAKNEHKQQSSYLQVYNSYLHEKNPFYQEEHQQSDEEELDAVLGPKGIKHFNYLRQYPKLLQHTVDRLKEKDVLKMSVQKKKEMQSIFKQDSDFKRKKSKILLKDCEEEFGEGSQFIAHEKQKIVSSQKSKMIIDQKYANFYSKSSNFRIDPRAKSNERCNKIMETQRRMIAKMENQGEISKQNMKKLTFKLNEIVNQLGKNDRTSQLPRIKDSASQSDVILPL